MKRRGIRYEIRIGIAREQWRVAIYPPGNRFPEEKTVFGTREDAVTIARSMIDARLKKRSSKRSSLGSRIEKSVNTGQTD
jgi:hypothetical protein